MTLSIAIAGAAGRMGRALIRAASADQRFSICGGTERRETQFLGADLGALAGLAPLFMTTSDAADHAADKADVWIDFTTPDATLAALEALKRTTARAAIVGTTGLSAEQEARIAEHAKHIAIVRSGNFSLGVTLLAAFVEQAAAKLGAGWDIEITEAHHRRKVDAPSGTALLLGDAAARGRGKPLQELRLDPYDGVTGERPEGGIGFSVIRGGGVVGEHDVRFAAEREIITLSHQALDRAVFADGALAAALWAAGKPPGLYSMRDVLGL
ncbi:MAG: 4-hydroxy-tetrahydrodipicolinate reductase [Phycisphaerales bacterium]|nr:4-hydroxy-tetrahydrodipicolinate reductase [Hyphomonadaceae bacterium]